MMRKFKFLFVVALLTAPFAFSGEFDDFEKSLMRNSEPSGSTDSASSVSSTDAFEQSLVAEPGTEMEKTNDDGGGGTTPSNPIEPCLTNTNEHAVFFKKSSDFGSTIYCYIWHTGTGSTVQVCGSWPGQKAVSLGDDNYKFTIPSSAGTIDNSWKIIWNDGGGNQTGDLIYKDQYLYIGANKGAIQPASKVTAICEPVSTVLDVIDNPKTFNKKVLINGVLYIQLPNGSMYDMHGIKVQ